MGMSANARAFLTTVLFVTSTLLLSLTSFSCTSQVAATIVITAINETYTVGFSAKREIGFGDVEWEAKALKERRWEVVRFDSGDQLTQP
jgi:hypothetical protein